MKTNQTKIIAVLAVLVMAFSGVSLVSDYSDDADADSIVAKIGTTTYTDVKNAFEDAKEGDTVSIVADCVYGATDHQLTKAKNVTIIGGDDEKTVGGFTLTVVGNGIDLMDGTVFRNVTFNCQSEISLFILGQFSKEKIDATFERCLFQGKVSSADVNFVYADKYDGKLTFMDCVFDSENKCKTDISVKIKDSKEVSDDVNVTVYGCKFVIRSDENPYDPVIITGDVGPKMYVMGSNVMGHDPSDNMPMLTFVDNGTVYLETVDKTLSDAVAVIGKTYYAKLDGEDGAFAKAKDFDKIYLLKDCACTTMPESKNVDIFGNGFVLTAEKSNIELSDGLSLYGVKIVATGYGNLFYTDDGKSVRFFDCEFSNTYSGTEESASYLSAANFCGSIEFTDCIFHNTNEKIQIDIEVMFKNEPLSEKVRVTVDGCIFDGKTPEFMPVILTGVDNPGRFSMPGNVMNSNPMNCIMDKNGNAGLMTSDSRYEAQIGNDMFESLNQALDFAAEQSNAQMINILKDCTYDGSKTIPNSIINGNGHTLTVKADNVQLNNAVDFYNVVFEAKGEGMFVFNSGNKAFVDCKFTCSSSSEKMRYVDVFDYIGKLTFEDCYFDNSSASIANDLKVGFNQQGATSENTKLTVKNCAFGVGKAVPVEIKGTDGFGLLDLVGNTVGDKAVVAVVHDFDIVLAEEAVCEAKIAGTLYLSLMDALRLAKSDQTIDIQMDCTFSNDEVFTKEAGVTINGHGYQISMAKSKVNLKTGTCFNNVTFVAQCSGTMFDVSSDSPVDLKFISCTFSGTSSGDDIVYLNLGNGYKGKLTVDGCTFKNSNKISRDIVADVSSGATSADTLIKVVNSTFTSILDVLTPVKITGTAALYELSGNKVSDVVALITAFYDGGIVLTTEKNSPVELNGMRYVDISEAIASAEAEGETVSLVDSLVLEQNLVVKGGVTLDVPDGKTLTLKDTESPYIKMEIEEGACFNGTFAYDDGTSVSSIKCTGLKAGEQPIVLSHGSIVISGTIDASSDVTIDADGTVKLNGVVVTESTGSLIITDTGGSADIILEDLTVSSGSSVSIDADVTVNGTVTVSRDGELTVEAGEKLTVNDGAKLNNEGLVQVDGTIDNNGTITVLTAGSLVNDGTISSSSQGGKIINSGNVQGSGTISPSVDVVDKRTNLIRFNVEQFVYSGEAKSGVDVTVMPEIYEADKTVREAVSATVKYVVADDSDPDLGTVVSEKSVTVSLDDISYANGNAYFEVDLKTDNEDFEMITMVWAEYTFQSAVDKQTTGISGMFKFNPRREYIL